MSTTEFIVKAFYEQILPTINASIYMILAFCAGKWGGR